MRYFFKINRIVLLLVLLGILHNVNFLFAQTQVTITVRRPPPNQLKIADLWEITINNLSRQSLRGYLHGTVNEAKDGEIVNVTSSIFSIAPGVKVYHAADIEPLKVISVQEKYKTPFLRTGSVPDGTYEVCVEVLDAETARVLGTDCFEQSVKVFSPPILVSPTDGSEVELRLPIFTWLAVSPVNRSFRISYTMRLVTMFRGQTPFDAMSSNPAVFTTSVATNILQMPISARELIPNTTYAWKITAYDAGTKVSESEIWTFIYKPLKLPEVEKREPVVKNKLPDVKKDIGRNSDNGRTRNPYNDPILRTPKDKSFIPVSERESDEDDYFVHLVLVNEDENLPFALENQLLKKCYK